MLDLFTNTSKDIYFFLPNLKYGGAEKTLILVANHYANEGYKTWLIVANTDGELLPEVSPKIQLIDLKKKNVSKCILPLLKLIKCTQMDIKFVTTMYHCNILACILKLFLPSINVYIRESTSIDFYRSNFSKIKFYLFRILSSIFYPLADKVIFPSKEMKDKFLSFIPISEIKALILPNPIDTNLINELQSEPIDENIWKQKTEHVLVNVGRLDKNKNQQMILEALAMLDEKLDWEFIQVGSGPEFDKLKQTAENLGLKARVTFVGYQNNPFKFMARSKIFILSSLCEGYPNVLVQAKYLGLRIISTDCPTGPREIIKDYPKGTLIGFNPEDLKSVLQQHLSSI